MAIEIKIFAFIVCKSNETQRQQQEQLKQTRMSATSFHFLKSIETIMSWLRQVSEQQQVAGAARLNDVW